MHVCAVVLPLITPAVVFPSVSRFFFLLMAPSPQVQDFTMLFSLRRATVYNTVSIFGMHVLAVCVAMAMNATTRE